MLCVSGSFCVRFSSIVAGILLAMPMPQAKAQSGQAASPPVPDGSVGGMGDINLYPKRVVIDDRQRIATVGLYNKSAAAGDYEIAVNDMAMLPDGRLVKLDEVIDPALKARVKAASAMLRWSPRRVALRGNEAQTIRIMARTPPGLEPGEYRAHFLALSVPPPEQLGNSIDNAVGNTSGGDIGVRIVPRFGISIPVILRVGETTLTTAMRGARLVTLPDGNRSLRVTIERQGTRSAFGDITVAAKGAKAAVAIARGVGIYTELDSREVTVPIDPKADPHVLRSGSVLTVTYTDDDFKPGTVLFRQDFVVP